MTEKQPVISDTVQLVRDGKVSAAIVSAIDADGSLSLTVFGMPPHHAGIHTRNRIRSSAENANEYWRWPE
jgi:hypothetical protein